MARATTASSERLIRCVVALALLVACESRSLRSVTIAPDGAEPAAAGTTAGAAGPSFRFSVASIQSPQDSYPGYSQLLRRLARSLDLQGELVQRRTYREINELLRSGGVDAALLCTGGYVDLERHTPGTVEVIATPVAARQGTYRAMVIVPASSPAGSLRDLRGKRFAYTDELSMTGRVYLLKLLRDLGSDPETYFGAVTYSGSHDRSIMAVASGLVDGAIVHGLVYDALVERDPSLAGRVKVIYRSPPLASMPLVVSTRIPPQARRQLQRALLEMHLDAEGAAALLNLGFERFVPPPEGVYASAVRELGHR
jgi:phosphonate transport system substrate-binding protein